MDQLPDLALDRRSHLPLAAQIARALDARIRGGLLRPGDRLPGTRALATTLGVHRNTVVAAYGELAAEGWLDADRGRGSFVSRALPDAIARVTRPPRGLALPLPPAGVLDPPEAPAGPGVHLDAALPDPRLFDLALWTRAYRRAAGRRARTGVDDYADGRGHPRLRAALAEHLRAARGLVVRDDEIIVTRGSQMALYLAGATLVRPGDRVAVEALGYRPAWRAFQAAGARLVGVPLDGEGARIDALAAAMARGGGHLRAVYLTPHHQYPTAVTLSAARRLALRDLATRAGLAIVEDDYAADYHHDARPVAPLAADDPGGLVVHVGSLSKLLAPGLRLGYAVASAAIVERMAALRRVVDRSGDPLAEVACAELLEDGELDRHARRARRVYRARRDQLGADRPMSRRRQECGQLGRGRRLQA